jgi:hypothetical protein
MSKEPTTTQDSGEIRRHEFGATQLTPQADIAVAAIAAREQAAVHARYVMAERHPRDIEEFRVALLKECERHGFAEAAEYERSVGWGKDRTTGAWKENFACGPTIRFIEGALRCFRNVYPEVTTTFDDENMRIVRVTVTDLEANLSYASEIQMPKRVERRGKKNRATGNMEPPEGREVLGQRTTTEGRTNYIVRATDDEMLIRGNALISKTIRTLAQRLLPADIVEECMAQARATLAKRDAADPDAAKRALIDSFDSVGVGPENLRDYLGHDLERIQPGELQSLRTLFSGLKEGGTTWDAIMESRPTSGSREAQEEAAKAALDKLRKSGGKPKPQRKPRAKTTSAEPPEATETTGESGAQTVPAQGGGVAEGPASPPPEIPEVVVEELPDVGDATDGQVVLYKGEDWVFHADVSAWRRAETQPAAPTSVGRMAFNLQPNKE